MKRDSRATETRSDGTAAPAIAIACQGGGSHTAFTAGALKTLLLGEIRGDYRIVALSGTSGGAICAALAWFGLLTQGRTEADRRRAVQRIDDFWHDNSALLPWERIWNSWTVSVAELQGKGVLPELNTSPYLPPVAASAEALKTLAPRREFFDLRSLLEKHLPLGEIRQPVRVPRLLIGAVGVLSGKFKAFDSQAAEISVDAILASATLPWASPAVRIGGESYWDGLFSQNPPVREFIQGMKKDEKPNEIWVIRINPQVRTKEPISIEAIQDRRNELAGNLSLNQEIDFINKVNDWISEGVIKSPDKKTIAVTPITMSPELADTLDYTSKLNRDPGFIDKLLADGEQRAGRFLASRRSSRSRNQENGRHYKN